jgi:C4-type Zn-finger protein
MNNKEEFVMPNDECVCPVCRNCFLEEVYSTSSWYGKLRSRVFVRAWVCPECDYQTTETVI